MGLLDVIKNHPVIGGTTAGTLIGVGAGFLAGRASSSRKKTSRKKRTRMAKRSRRKTSRKNRRNRKMSHNSKKRIRYTKRGQPYIIMANGRARFISMRSNRSRKKRKGGYY